MNLSLLFIQHLLCVLVLVIIAMAKGPQLLQFISLSCFLRHEMNHYCSYVRMHVCVWRRQKWLSLTSAPFPGLPPPSVLEDIATQKWKLKTDEAGKTCMSAGSSSTYKIVVVNVATDINLEGHMNVMNS